MLEISNLSKEYKKSSVQALKNINVAINNEIFGVLGLNGSGKSTLIKIIAGVLNHCEGQVMINNLTKKDGIKYQAMLSVMFQGMGIDFYLTLYDNLKIHGMYYGLRGMNLKRAIDRVISIMELSEYSNSTVNTLSSGYKKRLQIAKCLMVDTNVYIFDEPTVGLDAYIKDKFFVEIKKLKASNKTIIFTSQQLDEIERLCDKIMILKKGEIFDVGSISEIRSKYSTYNTLLLTFSDNNEYEIKQYLYSQNMYDFINININENNLTLTSKESMSTLLSFSTKISEKYNIIDSYVRTATLDEILKMTNN